MNLANIGINLLKRIKHIRINTVDTFWMTERSSILERGKTLDKVQVLQKCC